MVSSNDVKITGNGRGGLNVFEPSTGKTSLSVGKVAALRAHFAAEAHSGLVEMLTRERDELARLVALYEERMPEDVADLLDVLADAIRSEAAIADRPGQMARLEAIADRLEAAYSQKAEAWDEGANAELARARSQGADDPGIPHPMNPYRKGAVDDPR